MRLASQSSSEENIEAASFNELGVCAFFQNDLEKAIEYTRSGLDSFDDRGERLYYKDILHGNLVVYYERVGRVEEVHRILDQLWNARESIKSMPTLLLVYETRANLFRKSKMYDEAIQCAMEGAEIARLNRNRERSFDLQSVIGSTYLDEGNYSAAKKAFEVALKYTDHWPDADRYIVVNVYARIGSLYMAEKRFDEAAVEISKGIELARNTEDYLSLTNVLIVAGQCANAQEKYQESAEFLEEALELADQYGLQTQKHVAVLHLSHAYEHVDEKIFINSLKRLYTLEMKKAREEAACHEIL